jgi:RNA polymerase sigma-70 factor, ECF subfamily
MTRTMDNRMLAGERTMALETAAPAVAPAVRESAQDGALLARSRGGDTEAFGQLVRKYRYRLARVVSTVVHDPADVDDVVQETCLSAYCALPQFRGESAFYTWFYRIGVNTARTHQRNLRRRPPMSDIDAMQGGGADEMAYLSDISLPESMLACQQISETVLLSMVNMPTAWRDAITLRQYDGLSYADIAISMDCSIGTVRSRLARARAILAANLESLV